MSTGPADPAAHTMCRHTSPACELCVLKDATQRPGGPRDVVNRATRKAERDLADKIKRMVGE